MERIIKKVESPVPPLPTRERVAAYVRVSSGKDAMLHSLSSQISYFSELIQRRRDWEYAGVFVDEAVTGTKEERPGFQQLLVKCRAGEIDIVLVKSISRLSHNTLTLLNTVRELRGLGIGIWFELENIHTLSADGELLLTLIGSFRQEESRSVSENCKWRIRRRFADGELVTLRFLYGYRITSGGVRIHPTEAAIVQRIFSDYIQGIGCAHIAERLRDEDAATLRGGQWTSKRVRTILQNEKYTGNALLQKKHIPDHVSKKRVVNRNVLPQYYAEDTHEPIVDLETFQKAQAILSANKERLRAGETPRGQYPFTGVIRCGNCGKRFKRRMNSGKPSWCCNTYLTLGKAHCPSKQIPEDTLLSETAAVLKTAGFDPDAFSEHIAEILVPESNRLVFIFRDGHTVERTWRDRSRRDSWDDAMRQRASERQTAVARERRDRM